MSQQTDNPPVSATVATTSVYSSIARCQTSERIEATNTHIQFVVDNRKFFGEFIFMLEEHIAKYGVPDGPEVSAAVRHIIDAKNCIGLAILQATSTVDGLPFEQAVKKATVGPFIEIVHAAAEAASTPDKEKVEAAAPEPPSDMDE
jgi:hypothetical protein